MKRFTVICCAFALLLCGCSTDLMVDGDAKMLVVDGYIEDGEMPHVQVTLPYVPVPDKTTPVTDLENYSAWWVRVEVTFPDTVLVLTSSPDENNYSRFDFHPDKSSFKGKAGETYRLRVDTDILHPEKNVHAESHATILPKAVIDSIKAFEVAGSDTLRTIAIWVKDLPGEEVYYRIFTRRVGKDAYFKPTMPGVISGSMVSGGQPVEVIPNWKSIGWDLKDPTYYLKGEMVDVKVARIDAAAYSYWKDIDAVNLFGMNLLFPLSENPGSNIQGGLGYWCGYGSSVKSIQL